MPRARSITSQTAIPTALLAIQPRSSVAPSNSSQCILETQLPLVTLLMRTALARMPRVYQASRAYLSLGQTPKSYWRELRARTGRSDWSIMVLFFFSSLAYTFLLAPLIVNNKVTPIWNVMGVIPGHIKDEVVLVGNHRDGEC